MSRIRPRGRLPIIVYGGTQASKGLNGWRRLAKNTVVRDIRSPERLLEQASLFLHRDFDARCRKGIERAGGAP